MFGIMVGNEHLNITSNADGFVTNGGWASDTQTPDPDGARSHQLGFPHPSKSQRMKPLQQKNEG